MKRKYTNAGFVVEAQPMTKFKYVCLHEGPIQDTRYTDGVPDHPTYKAWHYWKGFEINWNGYTFWQNERDFHAKWKLITPKMAHVVITKEFYLCDVETCYGEHHWNNDEYIDQIEHLIHDDCINEEDMINYTENVYVTILDEECCNNEENEILKFGASWCGPCRVLDKTLESFDLIPVEYFDADSEENNELVSDLNIRNVPTMILVDEDNNVLDRKVGALTLAQLNEWVDSYGK